MLGDQADQHHQSDLAVDVERGAGELQRQQRAGGGERHGEHDDEGRNEAFELRRQHQVNDDQRQREGDGERLPGFAEFARLAVERGARGFRQRFLGGPIHEGERLAQRVAGRDVGRDDGGALAVEVVELLRRDGFGNGDQVGQRRQAAALAAHVQRGQVLRGGARGGVELHHHVVLLACLLEAGDFAPAEQGFQGAPDGVDADPHLRRLVAVDVDLELRLVELEVGVGVDQPRVFAHLGHQGFHGLVQLGIARRLHHELQRRIAEALAERGRVDREGEHARHAHEHLRAEACGDRLLAAAAFLPRFQRHERQRAVDRVGAFQPRRHHDERRIHFGHALVDAFELARILVGVLQGGAFRRQHEADEEAAVLGRRQFGFERFQEAEGGRRRQHEHQRNDQRMLDHARQAAGVGVVQSVQHALAEIEPGVMAGLMVQDLARQHRRQRQRDEAGHQHRRRHRHREFGEQLAGITLGKRQRREHRDQRERHRHHRETDFLGALDRRLERRHAFLDVAVDVFQHDDGIVHHQADRQHQPEQGQHVDGEAHGVEEDEGADQRHRDGDEGDQGGAPVAQEQEDHPHDQHHGFEHGGVHGVDRFLDEDRAVEADLELHACRQGGLQARQLGLHRARDCQRVGGRLLDDAEAHRGAAVDAHDVALVFGADLGAADVGQPHQDAAAVADDDLFELRRGAQVGFGQHGKLARLAFDAAGRQLGVLAAQRGLHVLHRHPKRRHAVGIEPYPHGIAALAADDDRGDAGQGLQLVGHHAVGVVGDFQRRLAVARESQPDDGLGVGFDLGHHRVFRLAGQLAAHPRHAVAGVVGCGFGVARLDELHRDLADFLAAHRFDGADALDAGQRILQRLGDLALHHLGGGAGIDRAHRYHRRVDIGVFAHRQAVEGDQADQDDEQAHHGGQHRAADGNIGEDHGSVFAVCLN